MSQTTTDPMEESMLLLGKYISTEERCGRTYPEAVIYVIKKLEALVTEFQDKGFTEGYEVGFKDGYEDGSTECSK